MKVEDVAGHWVREIDVDPMTQMWGRAWMTEDGEMHGVFRGDPIPDEARGKRLLWHFPAKPT